jgi:lipopolysaccharide export system permease protein
VKYSFRESNFKLISTRLNFASNDTMVPVAPSVLLNDLTNAERMKAITLARENTRKQFDMIQRQQDEMKGRNKVIIKHKIEWHRKFFLAVVCFVLFFIGAPLGAIIRKGGIGLPTLIALGLFIVYQLLTMIGERVAKNGFIEPWLGMWISTVVLLPMSLWITVRATKEAALLDRDMYVKLLNKLFVFLRLRAKPETI